MGSYTPHDWATDDDITETLLDHIEQGIKTVTDGYEGHVSALTWTDATYEAGWGTASQLSEPVALAYQKDAHGRVWMRGTVKRTSGSGQTITTLPVGFRPPVRKRFMVRANSASDTANIFINTNGTIVINDGDPSNYVFFDEVTFETA